MRFSLLSVSLLVYSLLNCVSANDQSEIVNANAEFHAEENEFHASFNSAAAHEPQILKAAADGDIATVLNLLEHDPDSVNIQNGAGWTPTIYAVANNHVELLERVRPHRCSFTH